MANSSLKNNDYHCPSNLITHLESVYKKYNGGEDKAGFKKLKNILNTGKLTYEQMKKMKSFFDNNEEKNDEYTLNGGEKMEKWVNKELKTSRDAIHNVKKIRMDSGEENQFKKTHKKDRNNTNATKVRIPKIHKSSNGRNLMNNRAVYETINEEIKDINYLIEYMINNNKNII